MDTSQTEIQRETCTCGHDIARHFGEEGPCLHGVDLTKPEGEDGPYCDCKEVRQS